MKSQLTITLENEDLEYLNIFANKYFEKNISMALRNIVSEHKKHSVWEN